MITELFVAMAAGVMTWVIEAIPYVSVPSWLATTGPVSSIITGASSLGYWVPFELAGVVGVSVLACLGIGVALKLGRALLSLVTGGGGSSA